MQCEEVVLKSGKKRWECVADGPPDPVTGKRNQIRRRGKTKREAKRKVEDVIEALNNDGINKKITKKKTFDVVAKLWFEVYSLTGVKKNTIRIRRREMKTLNEHIAKVPIEDVTHFTYQQVINKISPGLARTTVQGINTTANMIFKFAIRNHWMKDNPCIDVVIPQKRKTIEEIKETNIEEKYLERAEWEEFLLATLEYGLKYDKERFYTLAFSGMRSGELCALQKQDILFDTNEIWITKTLYNEKNNMKEYELTPPKTEGSVRKIEMEQPIMDMLKAVIVGNDKFKLQYRTLIEDYHDKDFIFARANGYPFVTKTILQRMNRILDKTSIKKHATPHIFRHTHISMLTEAGVDLPTIMQRVGHEDMETTVGIYTHVTNKMKKDASNKVEGLYGDILRKAIL
ncbi:site-specific integrase [Bacillus sp. IITD106]|nr:site-specific integrase [Bacillus sp. IITD106]